MQATLWERVVGTITPRDYQVEAKRGSFRLWDSGTVGTLIRCFTGGGKTIISCMNADQWLEAGPNYRVMVLSYEQELVRQFAQEIQDVLGNKYSLGIEMGEEQCRPKSIPQIVVASRQTLMAHELATEEQREALKNLGIEELKLLTKSEARRAIKALKDGVDAQDVIAAIAEFNAGYRCNHAIGRVSRLYKFDYRDNWLLIMDEAHKYSMGLKTVGHIVEWFEQNPNHRRSGVTATPKRRDKVSIGTKLFPGIALDFPYTRAVEEGYAVPYVQKYIQVESIDFRAIKEVAGKSQEKWDGEINRLMLVEGELARVCDPLLDMVGDRRTLIFSPSVEMAQNVADYINARSECLCPWCIAKRWYPNMRIGDGAKCRECQGFLTQENIIRAGSAHCLHGGIPEKKRRDVYSRHKAGGLQFLSVCALCREGYNDPDVACVAIFRPVSKDASSLAEQMKGRGSRPMRGCIDGMTTAEQRLAAIAASAKPNCLVVDLVGVTGLADCASTVQIYAEGLPDAILARAEQIALEGGVDDPREAVEQAKREDAEEKEKQRLERELKEQQRREHAERRARLDADVTYSVHDVGSGNRDPSCVSDKMLKFIRFLGMEFTGWEPSRAQASRIIGQLQAGELASEVARTNRIEPDDWRASRPSVKQLAFMRRLGYRGTSDITPKQASDIIDRIQKGEPAKQGHGFSQRIRDCESHEQLSEVGREIVSAYRNGEMKESEYLGLIKQGHEQRGRVF